jgi:hypothetical protein
LACFAAAEASLAGAVAVAPLCPRTTGAAVTTKAHIINAQMFSFRTFPPVNIRPSRIFVIAAERYYALRRVVHLSRYNPSRPLARFGRYDFSGCSGPDSVLL